MGLRSVRWWSASAALSVPAVALGTPTLAGPVGGTFGRGALGLGASVDVLPRWLVET